MSVNYDLYETPNPDKSGEELPLHARVVLKGSYTAEEFVEQVTAFQHMPHAQVVGVIEAISKELRDSTAKTSKKLLLTPVLGRLVPGFRLNWVILVILLFL